MSYENPDNIFNKMITGLFGRGKRQREAEETIRRQQEYEDQIKTAKEKSGKLISKVGQLTSPDLDLERKIAESGYPQSNLDLDQELIRIDKTIKARIIYGKFPRGTKLKGKQLNTNPEEDFDSFGDKELIPFRNPRYQPSSGKMLDTYPLHFFTDVLYQTWYNHMQGLFIQRMQKATFIAVGNSLDQKDEAFLMYVFPSANADTHGRQIHIANALFRLPKEDAYKLITIFRKETASAESFLNLTTAEENEIGSLSETRTNPKLHRVHSDETILLHLDRLNPDYFNPHINQYKSIARGEVEYLPEAMLDGNLTSVAAKRIFPDMERYQTTGVMEILL